MNKQPSCFSSQNAIDAARTIFLERYNGAEFCIAAGSIVSGQGTTRSDLDLVVVFPHTPFAFRESFTFEGMPIEVFVHDHETIQFFMHNGESLPDMIARGVVLPDTTDTTRQLQNYAMNLLKMGPKSVTPEEEQALRYFISDLIDDLKGCRPPEEQRAILYKLYPRMGELALRKAGKFRSEGKHLARKLREFCPETLHDLENVMKAAHEDAFDSMHIRILENRLENLGGFLFDGYRLDAPKEKRANPLWRQEKFPSPPYQSL